MNSSNLPSQNKVSQVFAVAGQAFTRLGELTMQLHTQHEALPGSKWTEDEVDMLKKAVQQFGNDLERISEVIKTRTMSQIKHAIKRKVYTEAGMPLPNPKTTPKSQARKRPAPITPVQTSNTNPTSITTTPVAIPNKIPKLSPRFRNNVTTVSNLSEIEVPVSAIITEQVTSDSIVDVENLDESTSSLKRLDHFISSQPSMDARTPGGVSESAVSNPPPLPPLDLVSEQT